MTLLTALRYERFRAGPVSFGTAHTRCRENVFSNPTSHTPGRNTQGKHGVVGNVR